MRFLILLMVLSVVAWTHAEESKLATSPDGRYEAVLTELTDEGIPFARIRDKKTKKSFDTDAHGYERNAEIEASWRLDSRVVALNFSAGRRTHDTLLYSVKNGRITLIKLPDFVLNILGRQGAITAKFKNSVVSFVRFLPDNQCLLFAHVEPDPSEQTSEKPSTDSTFQPTQVTDFDVTLRLNDSSQTDLVAVEPSKANSK